MLVALAVSSFLVGTLIGATGVGGVLLIPAIMFFGGLGTHEAMATALFSFLFAGIVATASYQRYGTIDWRVTLPVVAGSFLSGYAGAYVGAYVPARALNIMLACLIIFSSLYSMLPARQGSYIPEMPGRWPMKKASQAHLFATAMRARPSKRCVKGPIPKASLSPPPTMHHSTTSCPTPAVVSRAIMATRVANVSGRC